MKISSKLEFLSGLLCLILVTSCTENTNTSIQTSIEESKEFKIYVNNLAEQSKLSRNYMTPSALMDFSTDEERKEYESLVQQNMAIKTDINAFISAYLKTNSSSFNESDKLVKAVNNYIETLSYPQVLKEERKRDVELFYGKESRQALDFLEQKYPSFDRSEIIDLANQKVFNVSIQAQ